MPPTNKIDHAMSNASTRRISFLDTTLRDGEQAPGNAMTPEQKLRIALLLEDIGVDVIETGFPASSKADYLATKAISQALSTASFATFCRTVKKDVEIAVDAGGARNEHLIMLVATGSDLHLKNKRNITREQGLHEVTETVEFARQLGVNNVAVGIEDASRSSYDYLEQLTRAAIVSGANQIILADTTGFATPASFFHLITQVRQWTGPHIKISTHCHNDLGLGVANALSGVMAGADEVQATLGGVGERAGNTSLEQMAAILHYKQAEIGARSTIQLNKVYSAYSVLREMIGLENPRTQPIVGQYAFSTAAGIHQQGLLNDPDTYEYVKPGDVGRERQLVVARHSGRSVIRHLLNELGLLKTDAEIEQLYQLFIARKSDSAYDSLSTIKRRILELYDSPS